MQRLCCRENYAPAKVEMERFHAPARERGVPPQRSDLGREHSAGPARPPVAVPRFRGSAGAGTSAIACSGGVAAVAVFYRFFTAL